MAKCGAPTKTRAGAPCERDAMANGRCKKHGGAAPRGAEHYNYQGKGRSKYLKGTYDELYREAMADLELSGLQSDLGLLEGKLRSVLTDLPADPRQMSKDQWSEVVSLLRERREVSLADSKRRHLLGHFVPADKFQQFGNAALQAANETFTGPEHAEGRRQFRARMRALLGVLVPLTDGSEEEEDE